MDTFAPPARFRALVIAGLATGMASLAIMAWTLGETGSRTSRATAAGNPIAALAASPRTAELTSEKATRVREAIRRGDFSTAHRIVDDVLTKSALTRWHYHPFERFIVGTADVTDLTFLAR